jgi:anaerobic magnesium-protoporphyrin IX monomethyl ester cyclase
MLIGLINPNREIKEPAIHLGLGYLASYTAKQISLVEFRLLDTRVATPSEMKIFYNTPFDLIGITASSQVFTEAMEVGETIKSLMPGVPVVIGGSHASTYKEDVLVDTPFDYAVYGEGEVTFVELLQHLAQQRPVEAIAGLIYRSPEKGIVINPPREVIKDIDDIPFPNYTLFRMERYPQHRITTSRGCPYDCVFCNSKTIWTRRWRKRSAENVIGEIQLLVKKFALKSFVFNDDSFNIDLDRVEKICDYLMSQKPPVIWSTSVRADIMTPAVAAKMKKAGCYIVNIGIESANDEVLQKMKKNTTREKIQKGIRIFREAGIDVTGQFMIGNPGDTLDTVKESIEFAHTAGLSVAEFYTALPYKGSLLFDFVREKGTILTDKPGYEYHTVNPRVIYETPEFSYHERLQAIELARHHGFYHALSTDKRYWLLDLGKSLTKTTQKMLGPSLGNKLYLTARNLYRKLIVKNLN